MSIYDVVILLPSTLHKFKLKINNIPKNIADGLQRDIMVHKI